MKGLIIKDFLTVRNTFKIYAIFTVCYLLFGFLSSSYAMSAMIVIIFSMLPMTALAYDERAKFNHYALTMPISKTNIVVAKYLFGLILFLPGMASSFIAALFIQNELSALEKLVITACSLLIAALFQAMVLPLLFKFGAEKGRIFMMMIFFVPTIIILLIAYSPLGPVISKAANEASPQAIAAVILAVVITIYILSVLLSIRIVKKRGFAR